MNRACALGTVVLFSVPILYVMWLLHRSDRQLVEQQLDDTIDDSFPASDPPASRNFTTAG